MPEPPEWEEIVAELESGECAAYWKRASGVYTVEFVEIDYSPEARSAPGEAVRVAEAVRPFGDVEGVYELLLRTACVAPDSEAAREELLDALETIFPDESAISADRAALGIFEEDGALATRRPDRPTANLRWPRPRWPLHRTGPGRLRRTHELAPLIVDVFRTPCPVGFDRDEVTGKCHRGFVGEGMGPVTGRIELYPIEPIRGWKVGRFKRGEKDDETGGRTVAFKLTCGDEVVRGDTGGCSVTAPADAEVDMGELVFSWSTTRGTARKSERGASAWNGKAVATLNIKVSITDPDGAIAGFNDSRTIRVTPRKWTFAPPTPASASSGYGGAGWRMGKWGQHDAGTTTVPLVVGGDGPWEGWFMGAGPPVHNGDNAITLHSDFDVTGSAYSGANGVACFAATSSATSANVVAVNAACGTSSALSTWETSVIKHEEAHAASGDKCLKSTTTSDKIKELERITGNDVGKVRKDLYETWNRFWTTTVLPAFEGRLSTLTSPEFWEYRFNGRWNYHALAGGQHGGATRC
ncbi:hypothetical protein [Candidatus Palauibacter sp.]|uniref:hypothetical protein n=1 Tax=Candidatus Palauibacter sp. TaxID=3101350 RepID=UPI003B5212F2